LAVFLIAVIVQAYFFIGVGGIRLAASYV